MSPAISPVAPSPTLPLSSRHPSVSFGGFGLSGETGTEHIVLGLALTDDGLASRILKDAGIEVETVRAAMTGMPQA